MTRLQLDSSHNYNFNTFQDKTNQAIIILISSKTIQDVVAVQYGFTIYLCHLCIIYIFNNYYLITSASFDIFSA